MVWNALQQCGSRLTTASAFTSDSKFFCCGASEKVKIYNVSTCEEARVLEDHTGTVTAIALDPNSEAQIWTASADKTIKLWNIVEASVLETIQVEAEVLNLILSSKGDTMYIQTSEKLKQKQFSLKYIRLQSADRAPKILDSGNRRYSFCLSRDDQTLFAVIDRVLVRWNLNQPTKPTRYADFSARPLVSVAVHPEGNIVAVGADKGEIILAYLDQDQVRKVECLWHRTPVKGLLFTEDGVRLLSGGEEASIVLWHVETGTKQVIPRVGGSIGDIKISPNSMTYALILSSVNAVKFMSAATLDQTGIIQGVKWYNPKTAKVKVAIQPLLKVDPRNHLIVLNNQPGVLQFYNPFTDRVLFETDVCTSHADHRFTSAVNLVCFSHDGQHMITVDTRNTILKFWWYSASSKNFLLSTRVDSPHNVITDVVYHPSRDFVVTTGDDGKFKLWMSISTHNQRASRSGQNLSWVCRSVGTYSSRYCSSADFSSDGSLLAVSFGTTLTLWNPVLNTLLRTIPNFLPNQDIIKCKFIPNTPYIVTYTAEYLFVWNLLTCRLMYSFKCNAIAIAVDPQSKRFAVALEKRGPKTKENKDYNFLLLMSPESPVPLLTWQTEEIGAVTFLTKKELSKFASAAISALVISHKTNFLGVVEEYDIERDLEHKIGQLVIENVNKTQIKLAKKKASREEAPAKDVSTMISSEARAAAFAILDMPSHILPPMTSLFKAFANELIAKEPKKETSTEENAAKNELMPEAAPVSMEIEAPKEESLESINFESFRSFFDELKTDISANLRSSGSRTPPSSASKKSRSEPELSENMDVDMETELAPKKIKNSGGSADHAGSNGTPKRLTSSANGNHDQSANATPMKSKTPKSQNRTASPASSAPSLQLPEKEEAPRENIKTPQKRKQGTEIQATPTKPNSTAKTPSKSKTPNRR